MVESTLTAKCDTVEECIAKINYLLKDNIVKESYSKRLNILVHGINETNDHTVETKEQSKVLFEDFLTNALNIDPKSIGVTDIHRLPQHKVRFAGHKVTLPIVVKLHTAFDKAQIFLKASNLKEYNEEKKKINIRASKVYITVHLPKIFASQKSSK